MEVGSVSIREQMLTERDWRSVKEAAPNTNIVQFVLNREFNAASKLLAWKFVRDFGEKYGLDVEPVMIGSGCVNVEIRVESEQDCYGRDLGALFARDPAYRELFQSYDVSTIVMRGFDGMGKSRPSFLNFAIDTSGEPRPT